MKTNVEMLINEINQANQNALVGSLFTKEQVIAILQMVQVTESVSETAMNLVWLKNLISSCEEMVSEIGRIDVDTNSAEFELYGNRIELSEIGMEGKSDAEYNMQVIVNNLKSLYDKEMSKGVELTADDESIVV